MGEVRDGSAIQALVVLAKNPGSIPRTHVVDSQPSITPVPEDPTDIHLVNIQAS